MSVDREADDESGGPFQKLPADRRAVAHQAAPQVWAAARFTARRIRRCVPHRQRLLASASRICSSLGFLVLARKAAASMIMPLMQYPNCTACSSIKAGCM